MDKKLIYWTSITLVALTKTVRDNLTGLEIDEDESVSLQMIDRENNKLTKVEFDMSREAWLTMYKGFVKKAPYQVWVKATEDEKAKDKNAKGHWEKLK